MKIKGQIAKISTIADGSIRVTVDVQPEHAPPDFLTWMNQMVEVELIDEEQI